MKKPFNIKEAEEGKPVVTRDGRKVQILKTNLRNYYEVVAIVTDEDAENKETVWLFMANGRFHMSSVTDLDLFMDEEETTTEPHDTNDTDNILGEQKDIQQEELDKKREEAAKQWYTNHTGGNCKIKYHLQP